MVDGLYSMSIYEPTWFMGFHGDFVAGLGQTCQTLGNPPYRKEVNTSVGNISSINMGFPGRCITIFSST